jgi:hypothetical protein
MMKTVERGRQKTEVPFSTVFANYTHYVGGSEFE